MTGQDIDRLFELLAIFRPGDRHLNDRMLRSAWLLVLKPYKTDDVREAVASYFRECSYWPDVMEIAKRCPKVETSQDPRRATGPGKSWEKQLERVMRFRELQRKRREAGLPETWRQARDAGMEAEEYIAAIDGAGLGTETIL